MIAGDGPLRTHLERDAVNLGVGESVRFLGEVAYQSLPSTYASAHTLVLASTHEVWGLVVNEGLAAGLHVVVTDNCGVAESVSGMRGVQVVRNDLEALALGMKRSRDEWGGPVTKPEVLKHTPEAMARDALSAIQIGPGSLRVRTPSQRQAWTGFRMTLDLRKPPPHVRTDLASDRSTRGVSRVSGLLVAWWPLPFIPLAGSVCSTPPHVQILALQMVEGSGAMHDNLDSGDYPFGSRELSVLD